jgi:hypothetical protein
MASRQRYEQITPSHEERIPDDGKRTCPTFDQRGERGLKLVLGAGFHHQQFSPKRLRGGLRVSCFDLGIRIGWVREHSDY